MHFKLASEGRGRGYSRMRGIVESTLDLVYTGDWPRRLWGLTERARQVRVVRTKVEAQGIPPLRIAFASDLHIGPTTSPHTLDRAFELLSEAHPDVLLLGGDYVFLHGTREKARELRRRVEGVRARCKFAVLGNHDLWTTHRSIEDALTEAGAQVLVNASVRLPDAHGNVAIVGLDDPWTGKPNVARAFEGAEGAALVFVLCHAPEGLPLCDGRAFSLYFCGHTHGGHVSTPLGPPVIPGRIGRMLVSGEHHTKWGRAFVSRGVGGIEVPFRAWAPPDVVVVDVVERAATNDSFENRRFA
ncbi:MAG: metallophosphoesterase [Polyangiaceae bacterium]|nr:metallophosphoesterase [Polyangiaceae bacterium]